MRDFTLETFTLLLQALKSQGYIFQTFRDFLKAPAPKAIVLRHDVDARKLNSLQTARLEAELGIVGTYYFRMVPQSFDPDVIRQIAELGHEIGYHYEDLAFAKGNKEAAIQLFEQHLAKLRQVAQVETICMHGSPLTRYDNRKIWEQYDYRDYGIIGEPYFDVDFSKVLYLTDTGRRWDGERVSIRDKVPGSQIADTNAKENNVPLRRGLGEDLKKPSFHSTFNIIHAANAGSLPPQLMITVHPQRWDNRMLPWIKELIWQRAKNGVKGVIAQ
ncbi:MAG: hypothetical protein JXB49_14590 [Bacteroidales bacterium]|nr:hypothetical protein [Bacteroidales bacterium]